MFNIVLIISISFLFCWFGYKIPDTWNPNLFIFTLKLSKLGLFFRFCIIKIAVLITAFPPSLTFCFFNFLLLHISINPFTKYHLLCLSRYLFFFFSFFSICLAILYASYWGGIIFSGRENARPWFVIFWKLLHWVLMWLFSKRHKYSWFISLINYFS